MSSLDQARFSRACVHWCLKCRYATNSERKAKLRVTTSNDIFVLESDCDIAGMEVVNEMELPF
jgi:hypothetical protein